MKRNPPEERSRTVVLDRDGVINQDSESYITHEDQWIPLPGSLQAIAELHRGGYRVVVATNQSGLARGLFDEFALARIHHKLCAMVEAQGGMVEGIFFCPHAPQAGCDCRKPGTGLLRQIEREFSCTLGGCWFIGDRDSDVQAALDYGLKPVLVKTGKDISPASIRQYQARGIPVVKDLLSAVREQVLKTGVSQ